jgi:hypothetical protein
VSNPAYGVESPFETICDGQIQGWEIGSEISEIGEVRRRKSS